VIRQITITDQDGLVLDSFALAHFQAALSEAFYAEHDVENFGSPASEVFLLERLRAEEKA